jgi:hypothetical protein
MDAISTYIVTIFFREPSYELRAGAKSEPYSAAYRIQAGSKEESERLALEAFRSQERGSNVSWGRVVEKIESRLATPEESRA